MQCNATLTSKQLHAVFYTGVELNILQYALAVVQCLWFCWVNFQLYCVLHCVVAVQWSTMRSNGDSLESNRAISLRTFFTLHIHIAHNTLTPASLCTAMVMMIVDCRHQCNFAFFLTPPNVCMAIFCRVAIPVCIMCPFPSLSWYISYKNKWTVDRASQHLLHLMCGWKQDPLHWIEIRRLWGPDLSGLTRYWHTFH